MASTNPECFQCEAVPGEAGQRLDAWLAARLPSLSRSRLQALIRDGCVTVLEHTVRPNLKVYAGLRAVVRLPEPEPVEAQAEALPIDILHEDPEIVVINKPAGLVVHPAAGHARGTLVNALLYHCRDLAGIGGELRPGIVHRLDKDTSGVMVVAKTEAAMRALVQQFKAGTIHKEYVTVVCGVPMPASGRIETRIGRSSRDRKKMAVVHEGGRRAVTHYEVVEVLGTDACLRVRIETGRTHQIRVHLAHIGHPVAGDRQYGGRPVRRTWPVPVERQMLHARELTLDHPATGRRMAFRADPPADFTALLRALRTRGAPGTAP